MSNNKWMDDPVLKGASGEKLNILNEIVNKSNGLSPKQLIPYFVKASNDAAKEGIYFSDEETNLIMNILKEDMTEEEKQRIETVKKLANMMAKKGVRK